MCRELAHCLFEPPIDNRPVCYDLHLQAAEIFEGINIFYAYLNVTVNVPLYKNHQNEGKNRFIFRNISFLFCVNIIVVFLGAFAMAKFLYS